MCTAASLLPLHYMQTLYVFFLTPYRFLMVRIFLTDLRQNSFFSCPENNEVLSGRKNTLFYGCLIIYEIAIFWAPWAEFARGTTFIFFPFLCLQLPVPQQDFHSSLSTYYKSTVYRRIFMQRMVLLPSTRWRKHQHFLINHEHSSVYVPNHLCFP